MYTFVKVTKLITIMFFLAIAVLVTASNIAELDVLEMARTAVVEARTRFGSMAVVESEVATSGHYYLALSECEKLYDEGEARLSKLVVAHENFTVEDIRTWLSGVLANHNTCLDGLVQERQGHDKPLVHSNVTFVLREALAFYKKSRGHMKKRLHGPARQNHRPGGPKHGPTRPNHGPETPKHGPTRPNHGLTRPNHGPSRPNQSGGMLVSWNPTRSRADFVVAQDGSATHRTINQALAAVSSMGKSRSNRVIIYIKAGVYNEKIEIDRHMKNIMLVGDGMDRTIVTNNRNVPDGSTTYGSATFGVSGDGFWARDMTFENTAGPHKHQAVALRVNSDLSLFYRCSFKGYQDTLFTHSLRQFYRDCHIYGTIDFIFGDAAAVFQNCDIFVRRPMDHQGNVITAQGRDDPHATTGISIQHSRVRAAPEFEAVKGRFKNYLGRPWKKYSRTVFLKTDLDGLIDPRGWREWSGSFALLTLYYGEFMNTGAGAETSRRVGWPGFHVLRGEEEASPFTVSRFIQGDSWIPITGVPFSAGV
ncbi:PREDICTED: probable pectinesterase/pectinesterase inhibitor 36 [Camelina sativa]|uniref:Pectinesterase n=1 Tax=Camelina sativa TaxID=90675 RepID=A0ABM0WCL6_CAMSA|nr:PREDICTED: probable pectinesterase/pectinesterase inhibitor 36 [Camelina sativa]